MNMLNGIKNFLELINNNWTMIVTIVALCMTIIKKAKDYFDKLDNEQIQIAKNQIQEIMLKLISDAEMDYEEWKGAGSIKRSQVIEELFLEYPILSKVANQQELIAWIDNEIDYALKTLRKIVEENKS